MDSSNSNLNSSSTKPASKRPRVKLVRQAARPQDSPPKKQPKQSNSPKVTAQQPPEQPIQDPPRPVPNRKRKSKPAEVSVGQQEQQTPDDSPPRAKRAKRITKAAQSISQPHEQSVDPEPAKTKKIKRKPRTAKVTPLPQEPQLLDAPLSAITNITTETPESNPSTPSAQQEEPQPETTLPVKRKRGRPRTKGLKPATTTKIKTKTKTVKSPVAEKHKTPSVAVTPSPEDDETTAIGSTQEEPQTSLPIIPVPDVRDAPPAIDQTQEVQQPPLITHSSHDKETPTITITPPTPHEAPVMSSTPTSDTDKSQVPPITPPPLTTTTTKQLTSSSSTHSMKLRNRTTSSSSSTSTSTSISTPTLTFMKPPRIRQAQEADKLLAVPAASLKRQRSTTNDVDKSPGPGRIILLAPKVQKTSADPAAAVQTARQHSVPRTFEGGKLSMWWDAQKPNRAHHLYTVPPHRTLKSFILPAEAEGHDVKFLGRNGTLTAKTPSRGYTAIWTINVTDPRYAPPAVNAAGKTMALSKRRYVYHVQGLGQVRRPPVNPARTCQVTCRASPCEDPRAPLLPPEADKFKDSVQYYVAGDGPRDTPPSDTRPACRMVWTVVGTEDEKGKEVQAVAEIGPLTKAEGGGGKKRPVKRRAAKHGKAVVSA